MNLYKKLWPCIIAVAVALLCFFVFPMEAKAASESDLTFTLNSDGQSYSVTGCSSSASGELIIPATYNGKPVTGIGSDAFLWCYRLTSITIPDSVTSIGVRAFYGCSGLTSITIGDGVTHIYDEAFEGCSSLTSITIPDSVIEIGQYAFYDCSSLTYHIYGNAKYLGNNSNPYLCLIKATSTSITDCSIHEDTKIIASSAFEFCTKLTSVAIGDGVTGIGNSAFYDCSSLKSITIPDGVTGIGDSAFSGCSSLKSITIPDGVTSIDYQAFYGCSSLTSVTIGNGVTSIDNATFYGCSSLTSVTIGNGVTSIGYKAFYECTSLTSITIPNSVTSIGDYAFYHCYSLTSVTIGDGVTSIGDYAFYDCDGLTSVKITDIASWCRITFADYTSNPLDYAENLYLNGTLVTTLVIPNGVTSIGDYAFYDCDGLTSVAIGDGVTSIGNSAFNFCSSLTTITIPDSVTSIGEFAFYECTSLTSITIGDSVTSIGNAAFDNCSSLTTITIPDSVTSIGMNAFSDCDGLTSITIGDGVTSIDNATFCGCSSLTSITIPDSVTSIDRSAFYNCNNLDTVIYCGTAEQKDGIAIDIHNAPLMYANWQYHDWANGVCIVCGDACVHDWSVATCTAPKTCRTCGITSGKALDHQWANAICTGCSAKAAKITKQPVSVTVASGKTAKVTVSATGDGLTYQWYFKNATSKNFAVASGFTGASYSIKMTEARKGRQVYCVITDKYGNSVTTKTVTLGMQTPLKITKQPVSVTVSSGKTSTVTVSATGDGLTYRWYFKNAGASKFSLTTAFTGNSYYVEMSKSRAGRQVYCVITDKYGNSVTTDTVTLKMANPVKITKQPVSVSVAKGSTAKVAVSATGDGLTYKWYFRNAGASKFSLTTSFTGNSYSIKMDSSRSGRQVYCVITDKYGNSVTSNVVTLSMTKPVAITKQPVSVTVAKGSTAKVTVSATGEGLTYQWYYKNAGASKFSLTTAFKSASYSIKMDASRSGRQVYCVITDKYGNSVKTEVVTLTMGNPAKITKQPVSVTVAKGKTAKVTVSATGDGLTYQWYFKNPGASKFSLTTSFTGASYSIKMDASRNGRQVYCVITDKYGNSVKTNTVTLKMS